MYSPLFILVRKLKHHLDQDIVIYLFMFCQKHQAGQIEP